MMGLREFLQNRLAPISRGNPVKNSGCSEFEVDIWAISKFVVEKLVPCVGIHPFPLNELTLMAAAVCWTRPSEIFDWGTNIGKSARIFYECTRYYDIAAEIHSTDLPDDENHSEHPHNQRGRLVRGLPRVHLHQGNGVEVSLKTWRVGRRRQPLFFLDGDHAYDVVLRELEAIVNEVPDASMLVHDTFYQSEASGYNLGPHHAIQRMLSTVPTRFKQIHSGLGLPGMTFLYPPLQP